MKIKRLFYSALGLVMSVSLLPTAVLNTSALPETAGELTDGTFTYELVGGSYTIVQCDPTAIVKEVPELRNGYAVTAIGDQAFTGCTKISELTIPDTVKTIGEAAFAGCTSLKTIQLPSKLDKISSNLFMGCTSLESIDIPDSVTTIESYAFYNCSMLAEAELPASLGVIQPMAFSECSSIESIDASACKSYVFEDGILYNKEKDTIVRASAKLEGNVYIADSVKTIGAGAFSVCAGIERIFLPLSVRDIGEDAFGYCVSLKKVDFSEGLETIRDVAFKCCYSLEAVEFPTTLKEIGEGAFYNCTELSRITLNSGVKKIGEGAFVDCPKVSKTLIPETVTEIGDYAFGYEIGSDGGYQLRDDMKLIAYSGSAGAKYAKANKIECKYAGKKGAETLFIVLIGAVLLIGIVFAVFLMRKGRKSPAAEVKKADKAAKKAAEEESYEKIIGD